jgi:hypothetical protein
MILELKKQIIDFILAALKKQIKFLPSILCFAFLKILLP